MWRKYLVTWLESVDGEEWQFCGLYLATLGNATEAYNSLLAKDSRGSLQYKNICLSQVLYVGKASTQA